MVGTTKVETATGRSDERRPGGGDVRAHDNGERLTPLTWQLRRPSQVRLITDLLSLRPPFAPPPAVAPQEVLLPPVYDTARLNIPENSTGTKQTLFDN